MMCAGCVGSGTTTHGSAAVRGTVPEKLAKPKVVLLAFRALHSATAPASPILLSAWCTTVCRTVVKAALRRDFATVATVPTFNRELHKVRAACQSFAQMFGLICELIVWLVVDEFVVINVSCPCVTACDGQCSNLCRTAHSGSTTTAPCRLMEVNVLPCVCRRQPKSFSASPVSLHSVHIVAPLRAII